MKNQTNLQLHMRELSLILPVMSWHKWMYTQYTLILLNTKCLFFSAGILKKTRPLYLWIWQKLVLFPHESHLIQGQKLAIDMTWLSLQMESYFVLQIFAKGVICTTNFTSMESHLDNTLSQFPHQPRPCLPKLVYDLATKVSLHISVVCLAQWDWNSFTCYHFEILHQRTLNRS
jgi:hypothetical protein